VKKPWFILGIGIYALALLTACQQSAPSNAGSQPTLTRIGGEVAVAGEILVKFKPGSQGLRTLGTTTALESLGDSTFGTLARIQVPKGQEESYILSYQALPEVEYAEPNYWVPQPG